MKKLFKEFTSDQLARLKKEYDPLKGKTLSTDQWKRMEAMLAKYPTPMLVKIANADIPMLATAAKGELVIKRKTHKWSDFRRPMDMGESLQVMEEITEACWVGYKQVGMKDKGGRQVPNCVKEELSEADLSKSQIKKVEKQADDLPKNDFIKRYGKDGDSVRYATATNMVKKKLSIGEEVELTEGFEKVVLGILSDHGIEKAEFRFGTLYVDGDIVKAKQILDRDSGISATPTIKPWGKQFEEVELEEGRMKELHTLIQQGKSAEEISKIMGVDVKTIKSLMPKEEVKEDFTKKDFKNNERENDHSGNATAVVNKFGTDKEKDKIADINKRHMKANSISRADQTERDAIVRKYYNKLKEDRAPGPITNPEVAAALRQYIAQRPMMWTGSVGKADKKDFEELMKLALKDMKAFNKKFNSMDTDPRDGVIQALAKKGLSSTLVNDNKPKGDQTMNESYKDKFNATMKKFGINSLDDLKSDEEKKKFFKAVDDSHDAKNEDYKVKLDKHNCEKDHPNKSHDEWEKDQEKTEMKDLEPDAQKLNAMVKDPHKSKEDKAKKDMISAHSDSDVRPDVKNGGGADMSKVNDKPKIQAALKKISASYESKKYHDTKPGSIQDAIMQMQVDEYKMITVEDKKLDDMIKTYLAKGGTITKLPPSLQKGDKPSDMKKHKIGDKGVVKSMKMKEVREFITTYNSHFLTNYKAEEFIVRDRLEG